MSESSLPPEALRAACLALDEVFRREFDFAWNTEVTEEIVAAVTKAVAPFLAEHIAQRISENVRHPDPTKQDRGKWTSFPTCMAYVDGHDSAARIARAALGTEKADA